MTLDGGRERWWLAEQEHNGRDETSRERQRRPGGSWGDPTPAVAKHGALSRPPLRYYVTKVR